MLGTGIRTDLAYSINQKYRNAARDLRNASMTTNPYLQANLERQAARDIQQTNAQTAFLDNLCTVQITQPTVVTSNTGSEVNVLQPGTSVTTECWNLNPRFLPTYTLPNSGYIQPTITEYPEATIIAEPQLPYPFTPPVAETVVEQPQIITTATTGFPVGIPTKIQKPLFRLA